MTDFLLRDPLVWLERLLVTDIPVMKKQNFYQIRMQPVDEGNYQTLLACAELNSIGYVIDAGARGAQSIWLIVMARSGAKPRGDYLWRWEITEAALYEAACEEHPWLADVPQVFLDD